MTHHQLSYEVRAPSRPGYETVLTPEALAFVAGFAGVFGQRVKQCLTDRQDVQARLDAGKKLDFLPQTRGIRESEWCVAALPEDLLDRRVEITGPVDRKMVINALNSGASCFMADFEDANAPSWDNLIQGQVNLRDAVAGTIAYDDPESGKYYELGETTTTLLVRPRGWHLWEYHMRVNGEPVPAGLFDFGLFFFHNAHALLAKGSAPYFYLPKLESHLEARLWNDVFLHAQEALNIPRGTVKATVLIETLPAAFEMDEILYELREHSCGLNCGRWDYIFSFIKKQRHDPACVLPDRGQVTMTQPCMRAYSQLLIKTCHRRGVHAMGGMAAQIPIKHDPAANEAALQKVRADKLREVQDGHDGTWVAHPGLIPVAMAVFDEDMPDANQIARRREDVHVTAEDLLRVPQGSRTEDGMRENVRVGVQYIEAWFGGRGAVPLYDLMEDAATAEISRAQIWQWIHHGASLDNGEVVTKRYFNDILAQEMERILHEVGAERFERGRFAEARELFQHLCLSDDFTEFLTVPAYEHLLSGETKGR